MSDDRPPLSSLDEVLTRLTAGAGAARIADVESVSTFDALGRVLAADVVSAIDVPPADNSSMDGYAVRVADVSKPGAILPLSQRIAAGSVGTPLTAGSAARIFTGAQVPAGADAVVMQEQCAALDGGVRIDATPLPGQWIRRRGEDVHVGAIVLARGSRLTPQALGLAASVGAAALTVCRRPRVALFSTGDELVMPGAVAAAALPPGAIYNANRFTLRGLLQAAGCDVTDLGIVPDRLEATRDALRRAAATHDLILSSGGVSVGEEDHVKLAVAAEGRVELWQVAIKPGKPLAFGAVRRESGERGGGECLFIGLPGNPVSSFVTFLLTVAPLLRGLQGLPVALPEALPMQAHFDWPHPDQRREFLRVRRNAGGGLDLFLNQSSGVLTSAVWADGLVDNPPGQAIARGAVVAYRPLAMLIGA
ncbi:MAG: molybdopterin molybdotransferase MoeA [Burkholderiaceae bacterium]|nr:molybdopterin molybdotransferase MoeA [Burkholderiaceae bacterium]